MKLNNALKLWHCLVLSSLLLVGTTTAMARGDAAVVTANDADGDRIVDTVDLDDDNDGIADIDEIAGNGLDVDTDHDGVPDRLDLDSDNDGVLDWRESGVVIAVDFSSMRVVSGRVLGKVGLNGLVDALETAPDSGQLRYTLVNTDYPADELPDVIDLDSDNDGLPDLLEAGVAASYDTDNDARIDIDNASGSVGTDGIPDRMQSINDETCCDINGDGIEDTVPRNTDGADFPDFQDLDSDNDGVSDLLEAGGNDVDQDGRVDNFFDSPVLDGMDDMLLAFPFVLQDLNGNAVPDIIDEFSAVGADQPEQTPSATTDNPAPSVEVPATDTPAENTPAQNAPTENAPADNAPEQNDQPSVDVQTQSPAGTQDEMVVRDPVPRPTGPTPPAAIEQDDVTQDQPVQDQPMQGQSEQDEPMQDSLDDGYVNTGLNASGCSVQSSGIDWILLLLSVLSVLSITVLGWRFTVRRVRH